MDFKASNEIEAYKSTLGLIIYLLTLSTVHIMPCIPFEACPWVPDLFFTKIFPCEKGQSSL